MLKIDAVSADPFEPEPVVLVGILAVMLPDVCQVSWSAKAGGVEDRRPVDCH